MGEYAIRKSDNEEIKIGTCEMMYYLRYEDRHKVSPRPDRNDTDPSTFENVFWRLPFPDEDHVLPGDYENHGRAERLYTKDDCCATALTAELTSNDGIIQLHHESGLLLNVPCTHGRELPDTTGTSIKSFWNGKSWFFELAHLKNTEEGILPVIHCRFCRSMWRFTWAEVMPYLHGELKTRLQKYADVEDWKRKAEQMKNQTGDDAPLQPGNG